MFQSTFKRFLDQYKNNKIVSVIVSGVSDLKRIVPIHSIVST
jgi:hypothetical protein